METKKEQFGRFGAMMAMAGSAVGLGNLWRFPYLLGEYGGAAFLIVYLVCALFMALPIFMCEFVIGRSSGANCMGAYSKLSNGKRAWKITGLICVITCTVIFSYYSVIGGWCIQYFFKACTFSFDASMSSSDLANVFNSFVTSIWPPIIGCVLFSSITCGIVCKGVKSGIERFGNIAMPILAVVIIGIAVYVGLLPGASGGYEYMFKLDFSKIDGSVILSAMGQSFYSLSLGCGCIITYASYVSKKDDMVFHCVGTSLIDILFAMVAGCAIMPAVFAFGVNPGAGPSLVYETLPFIFSRMPAGNFVAIIFFVALLAATLTSSISMCEVGVAYFVQEKKISRKKASLLIFGISLVIGTLCSLSFGPLASFKIFSMSIFDLFDKASSNIFMTLGALLSVIFVGWILKKKMVQEEFLAAGNTKVNTIVFKIVYPLVRYVAPLTIIVIFLQGIFL